MIFSLLQCKCLYWDSPVEILSSGLAIGILTGYPAYLVWLTRAQVKVPKEKFVMVKEDRTLFSGFKLKYKAFAIVTPIRKLLMSFVLILLQPYPRLQLIGLMTLSITQLALTLKFQPMKRFTQNVLRILAEIFFILAHFMLLLLPVFEKSLDVEQVKILSWGCAVLVVGSFFTELATVLFKAKVKSEGRKLKGKSGKKAEELRKVEEVNCPGRHGL